MGIILIDTHLLFSHSVLSDSLQPHGLWHARPPCLSPSPGACSNLCPLSRWGHPTILSSPPAFYISQHQGLFKWVFSSHQVAKVLEFQLQHQSFWRRKQTEQAPSWKQDSILGWTVDFEVCAHRHDWVYTQPQPLQKHMKFSVHRVVKSVDSCQKSGLLFCHIIC